MSTSRSSPERAAGLAAAGYAPRFSNRDPGAGVERRRPRAPLDDELTAAVVEPRLWEPMRRFWAGPAENPAAKEVNESARKLFAGHLAPQGDVAAPFQRVVALTRSSGALVGWCGIVRRHLGDENLPLVPGAYIFAIAIDHAYHGQAVSFDGASLRPGSALMLAALRQVERDWDGAIPYVWARVRPENLPSKRLFDRHGFLAFASPGEETLRVRPAGLAPR